MVADNDYINNILALHFSAEKLSEQQEKDLMDWICLHKDEYKRLSDFFQATGKVHPHDIHMDVELAWQKVNARLGKNRSRFVGSLGRTFSYAACVIFILGIALFFIGKESQDSLVYTNVTDELISVVLPDSTTVVLYPQAELSYLSDNESESGQRATRLEGQAFFKVKRNEKRPFTVSSHDATIHVLGTSFLVNGQNQSQTAVYVREGIVQVSTDSQEVVLHMNEQALTDGQDIQKSQINDPETVFKRHIKQKDYKHTLLSQVVKDVEHEFNIQLIVADSLSTYKIQTSLRFSDIEDVLSELSFICNCEYKQVSQHVYELYKP